MPSHACNVVFTNVKSVFFRGEKTVREAFTADSAHTQAAGVVVVVVRDGKVACFDYALCAASVVEVVESHESNPADGVFQAALEANGEFSKLDALVLVSSTVQCFGVKTDGLQARPRRHAWR